MYHKRIENDPEDVVTFETNFRGFERICKKKCQDTDEMKTCLVLRKLATEEHQNYTKLYIVKK